MPPMRSFLSSAIWLFLWTNKVCPRLLNSPEQLDHDDQYDFIIMGAGNVLANRLSEIPSIKVLVIEAGISNEGNQNVTVPFLSPLAQGSSVDWNYTSAPQAGLNGRSVPVTRGFVLGGSSSINYMGWTRGSNDVWDNWANLTEDEGWSWKNVEPYYFKTNRLVASADGHNTTGQVDPSALGTNGLVQLSVAGFPTEIDARVINSSEILGEHTVDLNDGRAIGFAYVTSAIASGQRCSSATAYLEPVLNRSNLDVLITTRVTKLIPSFPKTTTGKSVPEFKTIEVAQTATGPRYQFKARKEVILSGGTVGTPQVLLSSGIGPKNDLEKLGIKSVVNLPDVGQHLADHPLFVNYFSVNSSQTFDDVFRNQTLFNQDLEEWVQSKEGLFVDSPINTFGFLRLPDNSTVLGGKPNPASGPLSANMELFFEDGFSPAFTPRPATGHYLTVFTAVVSPTSRGSITLNSSSTFVDPVINFNLLSTQFDIDAMVQAINDVQSFLQVGPWVSDNFVLGPFGDLANAHTNEQKVELIRNNAGTIFHPVGTARMAPTREDANWGVTDSRLLVKGTTGLRIVDASVFPQIPEVHLQALVYTVAERASDLIKEAHNLS